MDNHLLKCHYLLRPPEAMNSFFLICDFFGGKGAVKKFKGEAQTQFE